LIGEEPEVTGQVDATVKVLGAITNLDVTANLTTGPVTVAGQTYAGSSLQGVYRGERLDLNLLVRQDERHSLRVDGGLPLVLKPGTSPILGEANFLVHSDGLSLAFLGLFSREVKDVRGTVSMDVALTGPVQALSPSGPIRLQQGSVYIKRLEQAFSDINVALQLEPQRIRLSEFAVRGGDGEFAGNGFIALKQYQVENLDLTFDAKRFRVISTREYQAALSGQLRCFGSLEQPVIAGDLTVEDTTLRPDLALLKSGPAAADPTITVVHTVEELSPPSQETAREKEKRDQDSTVARVGFYEKLRLDVGVTIPRDTWVHMNEGSIELRGQVRAQKAPHDELVLAGSVETVRGWVAVQGRKFQLERGAVTFSGGTPIDPNLDIIARYTLPDYLVDVVIDGTIASPTVAFKSDPALEQADILSLLVFGKPANALSDSQKTSLQSQAVQALVGTVATDLRQALAEQLGIENLELDVGDDPSQSKIGIGKYLAPGVFVSTSQQFGGGNIQGRDVTIEYQLNENWQLKASSTARGNNGVDILWKKKY
jgi:translocation and assembly module TamB